MRGIQLCKLIGLVRPNAGIIHRLRAPGLGVGIEVAEAVVGPNGCHNNMPRMLIPNLRIPRRLEKLHGWFRAAGAEHP